MNDMPEHAPYEGEVIQPVRTAAVQPASNPFAESMPEHVSAGAVAVESRRAAAEVQGRMIVAKQFPRDTMRAYDRAMQACQRVGLAECAIYNYGRGGSKVEGPSIRLAEELARVWGNIEYGLQELSRRPGESEMEAYAWDLETNTRSSQKFTVKHIRDKSEGGKALTSERDVYEITANSGARRMRARILAILPPELVDDAVEACKATVRSGGKNGKPLGDRIRAMMLAFGQVGVTADMIAASVGHAVDQITPDELATLRGTLQAIKDGAPVREFFGAKVPSLGSVPPGADGFEAASAGAPPTAEPPAGEVPASGQTAGVQAEDAPPLSANARYIIAQIEAAPSAEGLAELRQNKSLLEKAQRIPDAERNAVEVAWKAAERGFQRRRDASADLPMDGRPSERAADARVEG